MLPSGEGLPDDPKLRETEQLATMLALMLLITFGGAFVLFLIFVSLGLFLWVLLIGALIAIYSALHYLAWGRPRRNEVDESDGASEKTIGETWPAPLMTRKK